MNGNNMSFKIEDDSVLVKYNDIWNIMMKKYIKAKVKTFNGVVNTIFWNDKIPKENEHYTCIATISTYSVMKVDKNNYPQMYLEECKYEIKKR